MKARYRKATGTIENFAPIGEAETYLISCDPKEIIIDGKKVKFTFRPNAIMHTGFLGLPSPERTDEGTFFTLIRD